MAIANMRGMTLFREARATDFPALQRIEQSAGRAFASIGMAAVAEDEPPSLETLGAVRRAGHAWVAVDGDDRPLAYLLSALVDGALHIEQVSVAPASARRGIGAALIDVVASQAPSEVAFLTLTTFRDVPWNAPYYLRLGFTEIDPGALGEELSRVVDHESRTIPGTAPRVTMRRPRDRPATGSSDGVS